MIKFQRSKRGRGSDSSPKNLTYLPHLRSTNFPGTIIDYDRSARGVVRSTRGHSSPARIGGSRAQHENGPGSTRTSRVRIARASLSIVNSLIGPRIPVRVRRSPAVAAPFHRYNRPYPREILWLLRRERGRREIEGKKRRNGNRKSPGPRAGNMVEWLSRAPLALAVLALMNVNNSRTLLHYSLR